MATKLDRLIDDLENLNREVLELKRAITMLTPIAPAGRFAIQPAQELIDPLLSDAYFRAVRETIQSVEDAPMNLRTNLIEPITAAPAKIKKTRTKAQKRNDKMQSQAFKNANSALRKSNGQLRKGVNQRDIAARAQRELRKLKKAAPKRAKKAIKAVRRRVKR